MEKLQHIKIYPEDQQVLERTFGKPMHEAMRKLLTAACAHPEDARAYTVAVVETGSAPIQLAGFFCPLCGRYIFKENKSL